ncbi:TIGR03668 family PPOX class F420-dependent oxidoreductase [Parasphingorhabdus pacifica]
MHIGQEQARIWFRRSRVARLATVTPPGRPHLVPVTFIVEQEPSGSDLIVTAVDHKPKRAGTLKRLRNITANPNVSLLVDHYDDDWSQLWWVRADGRAELGSADDHPELVDTLAAKYSQYLEQRPSSTLVIVRVHRWNGWSATPPDGELTNRTEN